MKITQIFRVSSIITYLAAICILYVARCPGAENTTKSPIVEITPAMAPYLDKRIAAIVKNPDILEKLHQESYFVNQRGFVRKGGTMYEDYFRMSWFRITPVFPEGLPPNDGDSTHRFALCVGDDRFFFWVRKVDRDMIGWVKQHHIGNAGKEDKVVVWIVPRLSEKTEFTEVWKSQTSETHWVADMFRTGLNCELRDFEFRKRDTNLMAMETLGERSYYEKHRIKATIFKTLVQMQVDVLSEGRKSLPYQNAGSLTATVSLFHAKPPAGRAVWGDSWDDILRGTKSGGIPWRR